MWIFILKVLICRDSVQLANLVFCFPLDLPIRHKLTEVKESGLHTHIAKHNRL